MILFTGSIQIHLIMIYASTSKSPLFLESNGISPFPYFSFPGLGRLELVFRIVYRCRGSFQKLKQ